ncbi:thymosin beta-10-like [Ailuropoda melanoleuca]|uniref:thymosin beta-10-like n=1 Tax=Ailuropoda melanoleuca TaxID=9646 RepID=UPI0014948851|nr:thymosin beta-10-like [Ailuropoda melanoleuca]
MANKLDMGEITSFDKVKLKKTETPEKNTLQTKETTEEEKQSESNLQGEEVTENSHLVKALQVFPIASVLRWTCSYSH